MKFRGGRGNRRNCSYSGRTRVQQSDNGRSGDGYRSTGDGRGRDRDGPYGTRFEEDRLEYRQKSLNKDRDSPYSKPEEENRQGSLSRRIDSPYRSTREEENHLNSLSRRPASSYSTREEENHGELHRNSLSRRQDSPCSTLEEDHWKSLSRRSDSSYKTREEEKRGGHHQNTLSRRQDSSYGIREEENYGGHHQNNLNRRQDNSYSTQGEANYGGHHQNTYSTREEENSGVHQLNGLSRRHGRSYSMREEENHKGHNLHILSRRQDRSYNTREEENHAGHQLNSMSRQQDSAYTTEGEENRGGHHLKSSVRCQDSSYSIPEEENRGGHHLNSSSRRQDSSYSIQGEENRVEHHPISLSRCQNSFYGTREEENHAENHLMSLSRHQDSHSTLHEENRGEHHVTSLTRHQDSSYSTRDEENNNVFHLKRLSPPEDVSETVSLSDHERSSTERRNLFRKPGNPIMNSRESASVQLKNQSHYDKKTDLSRHSNPIMDFGELAFGKSKDQLHCDDGFSRKDCPSVDRINEYSVQQPADSNVDISNKLKYMCGYEQAMAILKEEENFFRSGYSALDGHYKPVQDPSHLDDGAAQSLLEVPSMPLDSGELTVDFLSSSSANLNASLYKNDEEIRCSESHHLTNLQPREYYQNEQLVLHPQISVSFSTVGMYIPKEYQNTSPTLQIEDSLGIASNRLSFFSDGYNDAPVVESARDPKGSSIYQRSSPGYSRGEQRVYGGHETGRREKIDFTDPCASLYRTTQPTTMGDTENSVSSRKRAMELDVDTSSHQRYTHRRLGEDHMLGHQSLREDSTSCYFIKNRNIVTTLNAEYSSTGSKYLEFGERISGWHGHSHREGENGFGMEAGSKACKERLNNPRRLDFDPSMCRPDVNHERGLNMEDADNAAGPVVYNEILDIPPRTECNPDMYRNEVSHQWDWKAEEPYNYDPSDGRQKQKISMAEYKNTHDPKCTSLRKDGHVSGGLNDLSDARGHFPEQPMDPAKVSAFLRLNQKEMENPCDGGGPARVPASERLSGYGKGFANKSRMLSGQKQSSVNQMKSVPANEQGSKLSQRESINEHSTEVENTNCSTLVRDLTSEVIQQDGSVESENLVDKAFLRFSKLLNETSAQRKRYKEQGKAGKLLCSVCGSHSKEFVDTKSLVAHAFASNSGSKAEHLGLHKALCVLMGWNSESTNKYTWNVRALPAAEALSLKENLILWPPLVIIHNSSIGNKNSDLQKVVTIQGLEAILKDIGMWTGISKVCRGKPANQSIMVAKFKPTFSGLQAAERLHRYYADNKHGRDEYENLELESENSSTSVSVENVLYGYMGLSEDMDKLEFEMKKWCSIKSKKDIHAIADAPLKG